MNTDSTEDGAEEELTDGLFGLSEYEAAKPKPRKFLAWHRPRKHFVRHRQWCALIASLMDDVSLSNRPLRYLGLPGTDLLDIRHFYRALCEPKSIKFQFLGFNSEAHPNSPAQTDLNISLDEVRKLDLVDQNSDVMHADFCMLAAENTMAWKAARQTGPFDVINLDLCDGFGAETPGVIDKTYYNAVNKLMTLQSRSKDPWLLFLTTRTDKSEINPELLQLLVDKYSKNLTDCPDFLAKSSTDLDISSHELLQQAIETDAGHLPVFLVGISKWLIGLALEQRPPSKVKVLSTIGYHVVPGSIHNDLVSIAFRFEPTFTTSTDRMHLARDNEPQPNECQLATKALERVNKRVCADSILKSNAELRAKMIEASSALLEQARYDVAEYSAFLIEEGDLDQTSFGD